MPATQVQSQLTQEAHALSSHLGRLDERCEAYSWLASSLVTVADETQGVVTSLRGVTGQADDAQTLSTQLDYVVTEIDRLRETVAAHDAETTQVRAELKRGRRRIAELLDHATIETRDNAVHDVRRAVTHLASHTEATAGLGRSVEAVRWSLSMVEPLLAARGAVSEEFDAALRNLDQAAGRPAKVGSFEAGPTVELATRLGAVVTYERNLTP